MTLAHWPFWRGSRPNAATVYPVTALRYSSLWTAVEMAGLIGFHISWYGL